MVKAGWAVTTLAISCTFGCLAGAPGETDAAGPAETTDTREDVGSVTQALNSGVEVKCDAVNDFGYVGSTRGSLKVSGPRDDYGHLKLKGKLEISFGPAGSPATSYTNVKVHGTIDPTGQYANLQVDGGAPELESLNVYFTKTTSSSINSKDGIYYQTTCGQPPALPKATDLRPDGTIALLRNANGTMTARVGVKNVGTRAVSGSASVRIGTTTTNASLFARPPLTGALAPGFAGYFEATVQDLARCSSYSVTIDVDHTLQKGGPNPFADDTATATTTCLTFTTPITTETLGLVTGTSPDALIENKTIDDIVNSRVVARRDNNVCSTCHNKTATSNDYHPFVDFKQTSMLTKDTYVDDPRAMNHYSARTWAGSAGTPGWAALFTLRTNPSDPGYKPDYLRALFQRWIDDGAR